MRTARSRFYTDTNRNAIRPHTVLLSDEKKRSSDGQRDGEREENTDEQ